MTSSTILVYILAGCIFIIALFILVCIWTAFYLIFIKTLDSITEYKKKKRRKAWIDKCNKDWSDNLKKNLLTEPEVLKDKIKELHKDFVLQSEVFNNISSIYMKDIESCSMIPSEDGSLVSSCCKASFNQHFTCSKCHRNVNNIAGI